MPQFVRYEVLEVTMLTFFRFWCCVDWPEPKKHHQNFYRMFCCALDNGYGFCITVLHKICMGLVRQSLSWMPHQSQFWGCCDVAYYGYQTFIWEIFTSGVPWKMQFMTMLSTEDTIFGNVYRMQKMWFLVHLRCLNANYPCSNIVLTHVYSHGGNV